MTQHGTTYQVPTESELLAKCNKNALSKAMFLMHKAGCAVTAKGLVGTEEQTQLLQVQCVQHSCWSKSNKFSDIIFSLG